MTSFGLWYVGEKFDARVSNDILYYDQGQYHGRVQVEIRDRETGEIFSRVGDVRHLGNYAPIFVNFKGLNLSVESLLRATSIEDEKFMRRNPKLWARRQRMGPKDWFPI